MPTKPRSDIATTSSDHRLGASAVSIQSTSPPACGCSPRGAHALVEPPVLSSAADQPVKHAHARLVLILIMPKGEVSAPSCDQQFRCTSAQVPVAPRCVACAHAPTKNVKYVRTAKATAMHAPRRHRSMQMPTSSPVGPEMMARPTPSWQSTLRMCSVASQWARCHGCQPPRMRLSKPPMIAMANSRMSCAG